MTSPKPSLLPAGGDDRLAVLAAAQLAARRGVPFRERIRAEVGQRVRVTSSCEYVSKIWRICGS